MDNPNKWNHRVISWSWCSVLYRKCFSIQRIWRVMINVSFWFVWIIQWVQQSILSPCSAIDAADSTFMSHVCGPCHYILMWLTETVQRTGSCGSSIETRPILLLMNYSVSYHGHFPPMYMRKQIFMVHQRDKIQNLWLVFSFNSESRAYPSKH